MELLLGLAFFLTSVLFALLVVAWLGVLTAQAVVLRFWPLLAVLALVEVLKKMLGEPRSESGH